MSDLPNGWVRTPLANLLLRIEAGLNVKCEERPPGQGELGLVKISAVTWGRFDENQSKTLPPSEKPDPTRRISVGDLLLSRANTIELVGASVIVDRLNRNLFLSDKVLRLVVHEPSKRWINYALKTPALRKAIGEASSGNQLSMRNISQDKLGQLVLPLAPEPEQQRIADKLDTVLTRVDAVNTRLARVAPLLKRFRQSVLAAATSGRLTEEWRTAAKDAAPWVGAPKLLRHHVELDVGFAFRSAEFEDTGVRLLRGDNIEPGALRWRDAKHWPVNRVDRARHICLSEGDLILAMDRPVISTGLKVARVQAEDLPCLLVQRVCRLRPTSDLDSRYLYVALRSSAFVDHLVGVQNGSSIPHISASQILSFELAIPDFEEQAEIVRRVDTLFAFADRLEARLKAAQTATGRLTPALLAKAFRGELVPQDPNDEPASELLRRLQAASEHRAPARAAGRGRQRSI